MSLSQVLLSGHFLFAYLVYAVTVIIAVFFLERIHNALNHAFLQWAWDHVAIPLARAGLLILFILLAYPVLFGTQTAPPLGTLLAVDAMRVNYLLNLVFLITLLLPLIPVIRTRPAWVVPLQGIAACALLFSWLATEQGLERVSYWPGFNVLVLIAVIAIATYWLAIYLSRQVGQHLDTAFEVKGASILVFEATVLVFQTPALLLFSLALGRQLA
ncbi:MAG: hypothetical protein V3U60_13595 [Gammaproteobacteria bacterium]